MRRFAACILRSLAKSLMAVYFGGFTFYAAVVVPDLHDHLGGMETGEISRRVARILYAIGAMALACNGAVLVTQRDQRVGWSGKFRFGLLVLISVILGVLVAMHRSLGTHLDSSGEMNAFRSFHELYLTVWTGEWLAIFGLMVVDAWPRPAQSASLDA